MVLGLRLFRVRLGFMVFRFRFRGMLFLGFRLRVYDFRVKVWG